MGTHSAPLLVLRHGCAPRCVCGPPERPARSSLPGHREGRGLRTGSPTPSGGAGPEQPACGRSRSPVTQAGPPGKGVNRLGHRGALLPLTPAGPEKRQVRVRLGGRGSEGPGSQAGVVPGSHSARSPSLPIQPSDPRARVRPVLAACARCAVDTPLRTVVHRAPAPPRLLLLVPAPLAEVGEEGCDLSAGGGHRVCRGGRGTGREGQGERDGEGEREGVYQGGQSAGRRRHSQGRTPSLFLLSVPGPQLLRPQGPEMQEGKAHAHRPHPPPVHGRGPGADPPEPWVVLRVSVRPKLPRMESGATWRARNTLVGPISVLQSWMASGWARM